MRLVAAGSLTGALTDLAQAFAVTLGGVPVVTRFGPSGLMREGIETGSIPADVFFSARLDHARRPETAGGTVAPAVVFVRNRLCLLSRPGSPSSHCRRKAKPSLPGTASRRRGRRRDERLHRARSAQAVAPIRCETFFEIV